MTLSQGQREILDGALGLGTLILRLAELVGHVNLGATRRRIHACRRVTAGPPQNLHDQSVSGKSPRFGFRIHQAEQIIWDIDRISHRTQ